MLILWWKLRGGEKVEMDKKNYGYKKDFMLQECKEFASEELTILKYKSVQFTSTIENTNPFKGKTQGGTKRHDNCLTAYIRNI